MHTVQTPRFALLLASFFFALLVGCAPTPNREGTGEYIDDAVITTKVKYAIAQDPQLKAYEINVETFKGRVQLSGFVRSPEHVSRAAEVTRKVQGVRSVANDLRLK